MMVGRMMVVCGGGGGYNRNHGVVNTSGIVLVVTALEWLSLSLPSFVCWVVVGVRGWYSICGACGLWWLSTRRGGGVGVAGELASQICVHACMLW